MLPSICNTRPVVKKKKQICLIKIILFPPIDGCDVKKASPIVSSSSKVVLFETTTQPAESNN